MRARLFPALLLLLAPLAVPGNALAQGPAPGAQPLDRLLPQIRRSYPGQFLDAQGVTANGGPHYHLKWLTPDGRVMWLDADARTGRVVREAPGRDTFDRPQAPAAREPEAPHGADAAQPRYRGAAPTRRSQGNDDGGAQRYRRYDGPGYDSREQDDRFGPRFDSGNGRFGNRSGDGSPFGGGHGFGGGQYNSRGGFGGGRDRGHYDRR